MTTPFAAVRAHSNAAELRKYFKERHVAIAPGRTCGDPDHLNLRILSNGHCAACTWEKEAFHRNKAHVQGRHYAGDLAHTSTEARSLGLLLRYDIPFISDIGRGNLCHVMGCDIVRFRERDYLRKPFAELSTVVQQRIRAAEREKQRSRTMRLRETWANKRATTNENRVPEDTLLDSIFS